MFINDCKVNRPNLFKMLVQGQADEETGSGISIVEVGRRITYYSRWCLPRAAPLAKVYT
jgi:hypothetical protein